MKRKEEEILKRSVLTYSNEKERQAVLAFEEEERETEEAERRYIERLPKRNK